MLAITPQTLIFIRQAAAATEARLLKKAREKASARLRKLNPDRRERLLESTITILKTWRTSKFEFEGSCRSGLRSALCLEGWRWVDADTAAQNLVRTALERISARRPTWAEGQAEYTDTMLQIRTRCAHCGHKIPSDRLRQGWTKYCSKQCNGAATFYRAQITHERMSRAAWVQKMAVKSGRTIADRTANCPTCDRLFIGSKGQIFCSHTCFTNDRRHVQEAKCRHCSTLFRPKKSANSTFCSASCLGEYRIAERAKRDRPPTDCQRCGTTFKPNSRSSGLYCGRACASADRPVRRQSTASASAFTCEAVEA